MAPPYRKLMTKLSSEMGSLSPSPLPGGKEGVVLEGRNLEAASTSTESSSLLETAAAINPQVMRRQRQIAAATTAAAGAGAVPPPPAASSIGANSNPSTAPAMQDVPGMMTMMMMAMPNSMPAMSQEQKQHIQQLQLQYSIYIQQQLQQRHRQQGEQQRQQQVIQNAARHVVSVPSSGASSPVPPGTGPFPILPPAPSNAKQRQKQKQKGKVAKAATVHAKGKRWTQRSQYLAAQLHTPAFFVGKNLRSGKWTEAEETYANRIVKDFNLGALPDCKPGVTLRAYLSRKLHCSPMRISKKYVGRNVGKEMYLAKRPRSLPVNSSTVQAPTFTIEAQFYRSIDCGSGNVSGVCSSASSSAPTPSSGTSLGPTPPPPPLSFVLPADGPACIIPPMYQRAAASMPFYPGLVQAPHDPDQKNMPLPVPSSFITPPMLQPVHPQLFPPHMMQSSGGIEATPLPSTDRTRHFLVKQNQRSVASNMQQQHQQQPPRELHTMNPKEAPSANHHMLHQRFLKALNAQCANNAVSTDERNFANNEQAGKTDGNSASVPTEQAPIETSDSSAYIPEFLSGFENIVSASESSSQIPQLPAKAATVLGAPPTPTFTSKSFDDMHRFLGTGIPSMPSFGFGERNARMSSLASPLGGVQEPTTALNGPATDALLGEGGKNGSNTDEADMENEEQHETTSKVDASYEYALLAQRSAIAVMEHSAYTPKNTEDSNTWVGNSSSSSTSEFSAGARAKKCRIDPLASRSTVSSASYAGGRRANVISGSERSSSELGENESMFGSSRGTSSGSDDDGLEENESNQFDSSSVAMTRKMRTSGLRSEESTPEAVDSIMSERW